MTLILGLLGAFIGGLLLVALFIGGLLYMIDPNDTDYNHINPEDLKD